jgi:serine protease Do
MSRTILVSLAAMIITGTLQAAAEPNELSPKDKLALAAKLAPSLVRVEYTLRYDQADAPQLRGWKRFCPVCGTFHAIDQGYELMREQRPAELPGYLVSDRTVAVTDIAIEPRFVESIKVRSGKHLVAAQPVSWSKTGKTLLLELEKPIEEAVPLVFDATKKPAYIVSYSNANGQWTTTVGAFSPTVVFVDKGTSFSAVAGMGLAVSDEGTPVGMCLDGELPTDDSWKGSPSARANLSVQAMKKLESDTVRLAEKSLLLVRLNFRSPKADNRIQRGYDEEKSATELFTSAVVIDPNRILVLADLKADTTARLERITVELPDGKSLSARFAGTLSYYGAFLADLGSPVVGAAALSGADITSFRNRVLPTINLRVQGSKRTGHFCQSRIVAFEPGLKGRLRPKVEDSPETFFFDEGGNLIAIPVAMRRDFEDQYRSSEEVPQQVSAADIRASLANPAENLDPANVPLSEGEENRLAWLGVELQPLDGELARANNVSHLTNEGRTGALVSYVYPDSPAAAAGIEAGTVLLRLHVPERPLPIDISLEQEDRFSSNFPWDRLDEVPEQYFEKIPKPWPGADNALNRTLTDIGFGKKVSVDYVKGGKELTKEFVVAASPVHYDSAPKYASSPLGLTVRDLTYEVRRYFQREASDPGVIVTKIEPGSRASVAGVRPYEIITHVNDKPVMTAKDFGSLIKDQKELRLSVKRMLRGRVVKLALDGAGNTEPNAPLIFRP